MLYCLRRGNLLQAESVCRETAKEGAMEYRISKATEKDTDEILTLYQSMIGRPGCTWSEEYPGIDDVKSDIARHSLYTVLNGTEIVAAAATDKSEESEAVGCYDKGISAPCELSRLAVKTAYQNRGLAKFLLSHIETQARVRGFDGIRLLVGKNNDRAIVLYEKAGYLRCGECRLYDWDWYCYQKRLP